MPQSPTSPSPRHHRTDGPGDPPAQAEDGAGGRRRITLNRVILILVGVIVLVLLALLASAVVPRWYAQRVGTMVGGRLMVGSALGVVTGMVFTAAPIIFFGIASRRMRSLGSALTALIVGLLLAMPNLITLSIVLGAGSAAHAGQRVLDVDAPGFRGGTLVGAIFGAVFGLWVAYLMWSRRRRGARLARLESERAATPTARQASPD